MPLPEGGPRRTCVGCRQVRSQAGLVRLARSPEGFVEPDPRRRRGGRGAYLCPRLACLTNTVRRGRWAQAFRAPVVATPEMIERLRVLLVGEEPAHRPAEPVEGRR